MHFKEMAIIIETGSMYSHRGDINSRRETNIYYERYANLLSNSRNDASAGPDGILSATARKKSLCVINYSKDIAPLSRCFTAVFADGNSRIGGETRSRVSGDKSQETARRPRGDERN